MKYLGKVALASLLTLSLGGGTALAAQQFVSIGTGGVTGVYYPSQGARHSLLCGVNRWLDLQHQHHTRR